MSIWSATWNGCWQVGVKSRCRLRLVFTLEFAVVGFLIETANADGLGLVAAGRSVVRRHCRCVAGHHRSHETATWGEMHGRPRPEPPRSVLSRVRAVAERRQGSSVCFRDLKCIEVLALNAAISPSSESTTVSRRRLIRSLETIFCPGFPPSGRRLRRCRLCRSKRTGGTFGRDTQ